MDGVFDSSDFFLLRKKWYKKLKDEGFKDIEKPTGELKRLIPKRTVEGSEEYHTAISYLAQHREYFKCSREQLIIEWHADGLTISEISKRVKKRWKKNYSYAVIHEVIDRYRDILKLIAKNGDLDKLKEGVFCMITGVEFGMAVTVGGITVNSIQATDPQGPFKLDYVWHTLPGGHVVEHFVIVPKNPRFDKVKVPWSNIKSFKGELPSAEETAEEALVSVKTAVKRPGIARVASAAP